MCSGVRDVTSGAAMAVGDAMRRGAIDRGSGGRRGVGRGGSPPTSAVPGHQPASKLHDINRINHDDINAYGTSHVADNLKKSSMSLKFG